MAQLPGRSTSSEKKIALLFISFAFVVLNEERELAKSFFHSILECCGILFAIFLNFLPFGKAPCPASHRLLFIQWQCICNNLLAWPSPQEEADWRTAAVNKVNIGSFLSNGYSGIQFEVPTTEFLHEAHRIMHSLLFAVFDKGSNCTSVHVWNNCHSSAQRSSLKFLSNKSSACQAITALLPMFQNPSTFFLSTRKGLFKTAWLTQPFRLKPFAQWSVWPQGSHRKADSVTPCWRRLEQRACPRPHRIGWATNFFWLRLPTGLSAQQLL